MHIDKNIKNELLSLNDTSLKNLINSVAKSAGVNISNNLGQNEIEKIRMAISKATDKDAEEALKMIGSTKEVERIVDSLKNRKNK